MCNQTPCGVEGLLTLSNSAILCSLKIIIKSFHYSFFDDWFVFILPFWIIDVGG